MINNNEIWNDLVKKLPEPDSAPQSGSLLPQESVGAGQGNLLSGDIIKLPGNGVAIIDCAEDLFMRIAGTETMFRRGGAIVKILPDSFGKLQLNPISPAAFRSQIENFGRTFAWRTGANGHAVLKPTVCPEETAKALMATDAAQRFLQPISMITDCAVLTERNGQPEVLGKGYHSDLGGLLVTTGTLPMQLGAKLGAQILAWLIQEFDFHTPGDRARAFAMLLTPAMKMGGIISDHVPIAVLEANSSQTGKTYFAKLVAALYGEHPAIVPLRKGGVGSVDESFGQALVGGRPFILFDNFRGRLDSTYLESFLTATGSFPTRIPHCGNILIDPDRFILMMTSNGADITPDLANRSCIIRINKRERFQFRSYSAGGLLQFVQANRPLILGSVFSVIIAWLRLGKPTTKNVEHDFRQWAQSLDWICQMSGFCSPLVDHRKAQERVSNPSLTFLRNVAIAVRSNGRSGQKLSAGDLCAICENADIKIPGHTSADEGSAKRLVGTIMSRIFGDMNVVTVEEVEIRRTQSMEKRDTGGDYSAKFYQFNFHSPSPV
jgi:hypothetical protein